MSDLALYRKYRPQAFAEVLGQEQVVKVLEGAVAQGNIAHAYLFSGSRGTGKTSVARIFAHAIGTSDKDIYEIDAASNRGIDDVRLLREGVHTLPFDSKYKVYIIDEVHMLTKEAFNALLKTLEEPPRHAVFILATTEFDKLPETIVSRCQTFRFKRPPASMLKDMMIAVAKKEGRKLEPAAAELIALLADGSFRDAHGTLQKVLASLESKTITLEGTESVVGAPRSALVMRFVEALASGNSAQALVVVVEEVKKEALDVSMFVSLVLTKLRAVLLLKYSPEYEKILKEELSESEFEMVSKIAHDKTSHITSKTLATFLDTSILMRQASVPELVLELAIIQLLESKIQN